MSADTASIRINAPADDVFAFMTDPERLDLWSFGTWKTTRHDDGLIEGRAMQTGDTIWLRIDSEPARYLVDYHLGGAPDALAPRIFARVIPGAVSGHDPRCALLLMTAIRSADMDDTRWRGLLRAHAFEVDVIKSLIETGHDHREM